MADEPDISGNLDHVGARELRRGLVDHGRFDRVDRRRAVAGRGGDAFDARGVATVGIAAVTTLCVD